MKQARIARKTALVLATATASLGASAVVATAAADAYSHGWGCDVAKSTRCTDTDGSIVYNPWTASRSVTQYNRDTVCNKAYTANGTTKGGSGCSFGTTIRDSAYQASPTSRAYGYWNGDGGVIYIGNCAWTTSDHSTC